MVRLIYIILLLPSLCIGQLSDPGLTASYQQQDDLVKLSFHHNNKKITAYSIQWSREGTVFKELTSIGIAKPTLYKFIIYNHSNPEPGKNFYRLKMTADDGSIYYSAPQTVAYGRQGAGWLIFPNPVKDNLVLQYNGSRPINNVINISIRNVQSGIQLKQLRLASTTTYISIPLTNLGRGAYLITVSIQGKVTWSRQFSKY